MNRPNRLLPIALPAICLVVAARAAEADPGWRCSGPDCQESLVNDIEDLTLQNWPASLVVSMSPIRATCADRASNVVTTYALDWSLAWQTSMRTFFLGRRVAVADLFGSVQAIETASTSDRIHLASVTTWPNTAIDYAFAPSSSEVMVPEGSTGVSDLGNIIFTTKESSFWGESLSIRIDMSTFAWCTVDSESFVNDGSGTPVIARKRFASTSVVDDLAGEVRNRFHQAVRLAIGLP